MSKENPNVVEFKNVKVGQEFVKAEDLKRAGDKNFIAAIYEKARQIQVSFWDEQSHEYVNTIEANALNRSVKASDDNRYAFFSPDDKVIEVVLGKADWVSSDSKDAPKPS